MGLWKSIIRHCEFDAVVDHAAVAQIMKAKAELVTTRIKCLLERLASYSFNLYYVKGKDMILADYLSRHRRHYDDPNDLIPISFHLTRPVHIDPTTPRCLPMLTRHLAKAVGVEPPPVHGAEKGIDPHKKPEHQKCSSRPPPGPPPWPSVQSAPGQIPVPSSRPCSISKRFYCPNLAEQLRAYITGCHICQLFKKGRHFDRPLQKGSILMSLL